MAHAPVKSRGSAGGGVGSQPLRCLSSSAAICCGGLSRRSPRPTGGMRRILLSMACCACCCSTDNDANDPCPVAAAASCRTAAPFDNPNPAPQTARVSNRFVLVFIPVSAILTATRAPAQVLPYRPLVLARAPGWGGPQPDARPAD